MKASIKIDFSQFHPLDHWPGTRRCGQFYGGWRRHLRIAWEYHRREQVVNAALTPYQRIACRLGRHHTHSWHTPDRGFLVMCTHCPHRRPARPDEQFDIPDFTNAEIMGLE